MSNKEFTKAGIKLGKEVERKRILELIDELKNSEGVRARYHEKTIINMCEYIKQCISEGSKD